jgi:GntR family transcriptional regulator
MAESGKAPRYVDVATVLEDEISRLAPNSLLPTEVQLARRFGVSRITVRGALDVLERSGLVSRLRGRGTIVSPEKITRHFSPLYSFEKDLASQGIPFETRVLGYDAKTVPPEMIRERLELSKKDSVGCLSLARSVQDRVICHDRRYYPAKIARRLDPHRIEAQDASEVLEELAGAPIACPDEVATALGIAGRTLVLANAYTWRLKGGAPVEAGIISYRIDRCKFRFHEIFQHKKP